MSIELRTSPHQVSDRSVPTIMKHVVLSMLPICAFAIWQYGLSALALLLTVTATCLLTERLLNRSAPSTLNDWSAAITGILLALTLPPTFPLWMGVVAGFVAIAIGKALFGGLGFNVFNPALIGRAFVQAAFPVAITTWSPAFSTQRFSEFIPSTLTAPLMIPPDIAAWIKLQSVDAFTGATPLARWKFENVTATAHDLLSGAVTASTGETSAILILVCGMYLAARKFMDWRIPVAVLASAAFTAWMFQLYDPSHYPSPSFVLLSGGLMLGAVYMASDMATSPVTPVGVWIYGAVIGVVTVMIRYFGGLTEGVMYAILLGNAMSPFIDRYTQPRVFGTRQKRQK
ncbi:RnfABCDGE type electron transport complex subunit D [Sideroxydans lithotrophicus]|uniref:Ion-translocating oxidoreductase complex subunit D n=1 Tax=Sideroxydans lithotrophicus (strain ES-1) TaxID=580332 RepID=D5CMN7_SIDLE|nr:RnfABCDGE type electron transport complex subunit D [Sideroxydans lithotrophicus]ADE12709.1 electron transport complex, RnfABCDGE type, D subunit [Sideroxydans lithotrophicus ES-1]